MKFYSFKHGKLLVVNLCFSLIAGCSSSEISTLKNSCKENYGLNNLDKALSICTQSIKIDPKDDALFVIRGNINDDLGRDNDALKDYNQAISLNPKNAWTYRNRSVFHYRKSNFTEALRDADAAVSLDSKYPNAYLSRSCALNAMGRNHEASEDKSTYRRLVGKQAPNCP